MQPDKPQQLIRLELGQYLELEKAFSEPIITDKTTEIQAGYQVGVQAVLRKLRNGFVIGA